jgi:predicted Fe-Mo cluster-binding NifX family protein
MNNKSIHIAFAVNEKDRFEEKHFSNAGKFLIYEWTDNKLIFEREEINSFKSTDGDQDGGLNDNCGLIVDLLKSCDVKVLVSKQFGKNIQMVNHLFIPVVVNSETTDEVASILKKHIRWIEDELNARPEEYKLFTIKSGILKTAIRRDN